MRHRDDRRQRGLSLLELVLALGALVIVSLSTMLQLLSSQNLAHESDLRRVARQAAESEIERLQGMRFREIAPSLVNRTFAVDGLRPRADGQPHGRVIMFLDEGDPDNPARRPGTQGVDLNGNLTIDDVHTPGTRLRLLPIMVEIVYPSHRRPADLVTFRLTTVLAPRAFFDD